ncbi:Aste57867_20632 [Aphanomyces stellatus]|uniref:Aste57867_20632 protein n=1 Tax=Aphanomyces stellatus TaxID=120398 RepID=A0A485LG05_9STRA|nr:hypothetical protein As57867_020564 [Aphanomyces stellatus]VFT97312.1 Aste57867_20632 [Aphanomyces stellatus]
MPSRPKWQCKANFISSRWNKRAATIWSEDTASARALAEEMGQFNESEEDLVMCTKKNLATKLAPKISQLPNIRPPPNLENIDPLEASVALSFEQAKGDAKTSTIAPGLISVASCDTDQEESLALKLVRFDPTVRPLQPTKKTTNMRFLSFLRNVRRLETQYADTGKMGRMAASTIIELPSFVYSAKASTSDDLDRCAICLSEFVDDQELRVLPCFHTYHSWCIDKWLLTNCKCPVCILSP